MGSRDVDGKIFGVGLSRTGTTSLGVALNELGVKTMHYPNDATTRREIAARSGRLSILQKYDAIVDIPMVPIIYKGLDRAYPGSKFILTVRNLESWLNSMRKFIAKRSEGWPLLREEFKTFTRLISEGVYGSMEFDADRYTRVYTQHLDDVKNHFKNRQEDFLIMDIIGGESWEKLCPFLQVTIPSGPFPSKNDSRAHADWIDSLTKVKSEIEGAVPIGQKFVLIDSNSLDIGCFTDRTAVSFLNGGKPSDGMQALEALANQRNSGAHFLAVTSPAFWWFDYYTEFASYLRSQCYCLFESEQVVVFEING